MQNLSVGGRSINDIEERGEVEFSTVSGGFKGTAYVGIVGLERLGNPTINTVLLSQNLSFTTPEQASAVGGVLGAGLQYQALPNVKLFVSGEGVAMSDKSEQLRRHRRRKGFVLIDRCFSGPAPPLVIARQRVGPEVAGPMTSSAKQSSGPLWAGLLRRALLGLLAMTMFR
jgi:hypothetical protein